MGAFWLRLGAPHAAKSVLMSHCHCWHHARRPSEATGAGPACRSGEGQRRPGETAWPPSSIPCRTHPPSDTPCLRTPPPRTSLAELVWDNSGAEGSGLGAGRGTSREARCHSDGGGGGNSSDSESDNSSEDGSGVRDVAAERESRHYLALTYGILVCATAAAIAIPGVHLGRGTLAGLQCICRA